MSKLYVFDLDGTLIDSCASIASGMNTVLSKNGLREIEGELFNFLLGDGPEVLMTRVLDIEEREGLLKGVDRENFEPKILKEYLDFYAKMDDSDMKAYPHIKESLGQLRDKGKLLAVCTNKPEIPTKRILKNIFGEDYFFSIKSFNGTYPRKPDPTMLNEIIAESGLTKDDIAYFGDTNTDIQTCVNAGVKSVGVTWGFRDRKELEEAGADYIIDDPRQIIDF
ncbi:MAG: HAD family hydrolase [Finegoldia sp.]|nr:HAD family hydrolase [Finegoldia sp.]